MKRSWLLFASAGAALGFAFVRQRAARASARELVRLDAEFHGAYGRVRSAASRADPALVLYGDTLFLLEGERSREFVASAPATQLIKATAHVPVGIFAALERSFGEPFDEHAAARFAALLHAQRDAEDRLEGLDEATRRDVETVLDTSLAFVERALSRRHVAEAELDGFAAALGPVLLRLTEQATRLELAALHAAVEAALRELPEAQRRGLEVVVAGAHQARERSLGLQYFQERFGEAPGEERRVSFAEAAADVSAARELIGTRRLDRAIAAAFFGDAKRLQRDVLGDAAARLLEHTKFDRIE